MLCTKRPKLPQLSDGWNSHRCSTYSRRVQVKSALTPWRATSTALNCQAMVPQMIAAEATGNHITKGMTGCIHPSQRQEISWLKGKKVATLTTLSAVAKPKLFENNLKEQGAEIVHTETPDNLRKFTKRQEIIALVNRAKDSGAVAIITPLKSDDIKLVEEPNENLQHFPGLLKIDRLDLPIYYTHGSTYGSLFYLIIGAHALHVMIALGVLLFVYTRLKQGRLTNGAFGAARVFWHFVVGLWPVLYILVYLL
mgnify:CR=1 FL=1